MIIEYWTTKGFKRRIVKNQFWNECVQSVLWNSLHSPDENTPALINPITNSQFYYKNGNIHRLTGPAVITVNYSSEFWLDGKFYGNIHSWLKDNPNPDLYFNAIGIFTETDKILWFLQN
jgi:hypothetical protein